MTSSPEHHTELVRVKKAGRWVVEVPAPDASPSSGTSLTFTRRGVEVAGWYDHCCGTGDGWELSWADLEAIRQKVWNS
jgi:hypothetical protein